LQGTDQSALLPQWDALEARGRSPDSTTSRHQALDTIWNSFSIFPIRKQPVLPLRGSNPAGPEAFSRGEESAARGCLDVTRKMVPEGAKIALIGEHFSALAQELGGEYDGWETSLVN
jgi:hypothetical protein